MLNPYITRILLVDGSSVTRELLTRSLKDEIMHIEVVSCENGQQALQHLEEGNFGLVTTAVMLPDMDGLALCRTIRQSKKHSYTPVIVVSGDANDRLLREGFAAGVTDYYDKSKGYKAFGSFVCAFIKRHAGLTGEILYVEDSRTAAAVTIKMLEKHGLEVTHTTTAEAALKILQQDRKAGNGDIDLVITDFYLQGDMTGGDLVHAIRVQLHYIQQELPVLVLTSNDDEKTQIEVFRAGGNDFVRKPIVEQVMMARVRALLLIKHQYDELKQQAEKMRWIAATDSLTGTRSKRYLIDHGEAFIHDQDQQSVSGILIDIDHFKKINDMHGHITGDHVLAGMGDKLNKCFPDGMVVRFGGEEFCILLPNTDVEASLQRVEHLRQEIEQLKPADIDVTVSIGLVSAADYPAETLSRFLGLADKALYAAKENGRNRVYLYGPDGPRHHSG